MWTIGEHRSVSGATLLAILSAMLICWPFNVTGFCETQYSYPSAKNPVTDIFFLDTLHGWILASEGKGSILLRTADGGKSWSQVSAQPPLYRIFFLTTQHGWGLAVHWLKETAPFIYLYKTLDGGKKWSEESVLATVQSNSSAIIEDLWFTDDTHGWLVGHDSGGVGIALYTTEGGKSIRDANAISGRESLRHIHAEGRDKLWIFGTDTIISSFDAGKTWKSELDLDHMLGDRKTTMLTSGIVLSDGHGWAAGQGTAATILATSDFGMWSVALTFEEGNFFNSISFYDTTHGCAVGASTILYCTADAGRTWGLRRVLPKAEDKNTSVNVDNSFMNPLSHSKARLGHL